MESEMMVVLTVGIGCFSFLAFIKILSDNRVRNRLIDKGPLDENVKFLYADRTEYRGPSALKWGMVLIAVGLAFLLGQLVPDYQGEITIGCMFVFAGLALLLYYVIGGRMLKDNSPD